MRKVFTAIIAVVILVGGGSAVFISNFLPRQRPAPDIAVEITPELLERGTYLVENVLGCNDCHSERDWTVYGAPPKLPVGAGRECLTRDMETVGIRVAGQDAFPGTLCIRNITPDPDSGIGTWTDGELSRATREGVDRHGDGLFPMMPYFIYRHISDQDMRAVIVYMRSLPPVSSERTGRDIDFPMSTLIQLFPEPLDGPVPHPDEADRIARGEYLATIGRCEFCHTPREPRSREGLPGKRFAGGVPFALGSATKYSSNLTPHETGIGNWSREDFIARFKAYSEPRPVNSVEENTLMNWVSFSGISEDDLGAIYDFLQTLDPVPLELP